MAQTAVEWFAKQVEENFGWYPVDIIEQAKQMEREQIEEAWKDGWQTLIYSEHSADRYYTQNYGNNQNK